MATLDLTCKQGATFARTVTWRDSAGSLVNLTGYTARMQVRRHKSDSVTLLSLTSGSGLTLGGAAGTIAILISATNTALQTQNGVYDLELVSAGGVVTRLLEGAWTLSKEVTRS